MHFSGTYAPDDVIFMVIPMQNATAAVVTEDGKSVNERLPGPDFKEVFSQYLLSNATSLARLIASLALSIKDQVGDKKIALVSLMRGGTPIGVLLQRALGRSRCTHYSISYVGGLDWCALDRIRAQHRDDEIIFVDGWTAQGRMVDQIQRSVDQYNESRGAELSALLTVVSDLSGKSARAATSVDAIIPSAALNGIVSGGVGTTFLIGEEQCHGAVWDPSGCADDLSNLFVDTIDQQVQEVLSRPVSPLDWDGDIRKHLQQRMENFFAEAPQHRHRYKLGANETLRALLRLATEVIPPGARARKHLILVKTTSDAELAPILTLARDLSVPILTDPALPYRIITIRL